MNDKKYTYMASTIEEALDLVKNHGEGVKEVSISPVSEVKEKPVGEQECFPVLKGEGELPNLVLNKEEYCIGYDKTFSDYYTENKKISRKHLIIIKKGDMYYAVDQGSTNGTLLNGEKLAPAIHARLKSGDLLTIGDDDFVFWEEK